MGTVRVVAAIIRRGCTVLATQRGYGDQAGGWEFPGGKIEPGETPEEALVREIREELAADIGIERPVCTVRHDYGSFLLDMDCFLCTLRSDLTLREHRAARWLTAAQLESLPWLPADVAVARQVLEQRLI